MQLEQQLILERYRPLDELGEGGFGVVVLAWDTRMQRRVAIKRMPLPLDARGVPHRPPGLSEARTAAMLNHPAIVTVFDFDTDADEALLVMEFVDGASLAHVLDDVGGSLTLDEAAAVLGAVADALEFAHDNGVLHLDIKPENVLIDRDGRVKVADFGMAELSTLAGHGSAWGGTPGYMPIEQLEGGTVSERTDEWALAALAYESLTGDNPFAEDTPQAAIVRLEMLDPAPPSSFEPELAPEVDEALLVALGIRPADRFASVAEFADALLPHLGDAALGRASLAEIVDEFAAEELDAEQPRFDGIGVWDRLQGRSGALALRAVAAVEAGWLAWAGLQPLGLEPFALAATAGLVAAAGAMAPPLGVLLGIGCFAVGLATAGAWLGFALVLLIGAPWWWFVARRSAGAAVLPLAGPVLAAVRLGFAQPLLAGFALTPARAAATGLLGGVLTALASVATMHLAPYLAVTPPLALDVWRADLTLGGVRALLLSPAAWIALAGWPLAAATMSIACSRARRIGAVAGTIAGTAILGGMYLLAEEVARATSTTGVWIGPDMGWPLGASFILMLLVVALGAPIRAEEHGTARRVANRG